MLFHRTHTDTDIRSHTLGLYIHTRPYPGDADDVVAGRPPRPAQGESTTVEVGLVYLITDKGLDLAPELARTEEPVAPTEFSGTKGARRRFTDMDLAPFATGGWHDGDDDVPQYSRRRAGRREAKTGNG